MRKKTKDIFQPKSTRAVRVLLAHSGTRWRILNLAKEAEVSLGLGKTIDPGYLVPEELARTSLGSDSPCEWSLTTSLKGFWLGTESMEPWTGNTVLVRTLPESSTASRPRARFVAGFLGYAF